VVERRVRNNVCYYAQTPNMAETRAMYRLPRKAPRMAFQYYSPLKIYSGSPSNNTPELTTLQHWPIPGSVANKGFCEHLIFLTLGI